MLVGDTGSGKTCIIRSYLNNAYDDHYEPTVLDVYSGTKPVNRVPTKLEIHDTTGDDNLMPSRAIQYQNADVFLLCVPVANQALDSDSYSDYLYKERIPIWATEILSVHRDKPIFLVLTKEDLHGNEDMDCENPVTTRMLEDYKASNG